MSKCVKCDKESVYDSPAILCEEHWIKWWTGNDPDDSLGLDSKEAEEYYNDVVKWMKEKKQGLTSKVSVVN